MNDVALRVQIIKPSQQESEQRFQEIARHASMPQPPLECRQGLSHKLIHQTQMDSKLTFNFE